MIESLKIIRVVIIAILKKDLLQERRTKETFIPILIFGMLVILIFGFAVNPSPVVLASIAPGLVWVAFVLAGFLAANRSLVIEIQEETIDLLLLAPIAREFIYYGKLLATYLLMLFVELLMLPVLAILFEINLLNIEFALILMIATFGLAVVGTLLSAISVNTKTREVMLPILFFPMIIPIIICAVASTELVLGGSGLGDIRGWLQMLLIFDIVFFVLAGLCFDFILEE